MYLPAVEASAAVSNEITAVVPTVQLRDTIPLFEISEATKAARVILAAVTVHAATTLAVVFKTPVVVVA